jgi:demethylmenaquinone methyltransferase / 2-methoxy-6-polyprenyl-1,4-benzoquinol methylase
MTTIESMFNQIASHYDFLNHLFSLNTDRKWRQVLSRQVAPPAGATILDCCTGTADQAISLARHLPDSRITGIDVAADMLKAARTKVARLGMEGQIALRKGDVAAIPFENNSVDLVTFSFGLRNVTDKRKALGETHRVLKPGGVLCILEFSPSPSRFIRALFQFYMRRVMPAVGGKLFGSAAPYRYLSTSIEGFLTNDEMENLLRKAGYELVSQKSLSFGIACLHTAHKPSPADSGSKKMQTP